MGWLDWLNSAATNIESQPDAIWLCDADKFAGIGRAVARVRAQASPPMAMALIAHFPETLHALQRVATVHAPPFRIGVLLANGLSERALTTFIGNARQPIHVIVAERHPHPLHDASVASILRRTPYCYQLAYHVSFDDALVQLAGWDYARRSLQLLTPCEDDPIHSRVVERRLRRIQRKIAARAASNLPTESAAAWLRVNAPSL